MNRAYRLPPRRTNRSALLFARKQFVDGGADSAFMGDASSDFAAATRELHNIAAQAMNAQDSGDMGLYGVLMMQYRTALARLYPAQQRQIQAALANDMPSDFLTQLSGLADSFQSLIKFGLIGLAVYAAVRMVKR